MAGTSSTACSAGGRARSRSLTVAGLLGLAQTLAKLVRLGGAGVRDRRGAPLPSARPGGGPPDPAAALVVGLACVLVFALTFVPHPFK